MPIQIIEENRRPSSGERAGNAFNQIAQAASEYMNAQKQQRIMQQENEAIKQNFGIDLGGIQSPDERKAILGEMLKSQGKQDLFEKKSGFLGQLFQGNQNKKQIGQELAGEKPSSQEEQLLQHLPQNVDVSQIPDEAIAQATAVDPQLGSALQRMKDVALREKRADQKSQRQEFEGDRTFHSKRSDELLKQADIDRQTVRKKEDALIRMEDAIQNMPGGFDQDFLAETFGYEPLRTSKGTQLKTALKEFLLGNISRVGSRPNMWIEQQIGDMSAKIGRTKEANETFITSAKADLDVERKRLELMGDLEDFYNRKLGYVPNTIGKEVEKSLKPYAEERQKNLAYDLRLIHEREMNPKKLSELKEVPKGTPLTLEKADAIRQKSPGNSDEEREKNALKIAERLGYLIMPDQFYESL